MLTLAVLTWTPPPALMPKTAHCDLMGRPCLSMQRVNIQNSIPLFSLCFSLTHPLVSF